MFDFLKDQQLIDGWLKGVVPLVTSLIALAGLLYQLRRSAPSRRRFLLRYDLENLKLAKDLGLEKDSVKPRLDELLTRDKEESVVSNWRSASNIALEAFIAIAIAGGVGYLGLLAAIAQGYWWVLAGVLWVIAAVFLWVPIDAFKEERKKQKRRTTSHPKGSTLAK